MTVQRTWPLLFLVAAAACAGEEQQGPDACDEHIGSIVVPEDSDVPKQAKVTLVDRDDRTLDDDGVPQSVTRGQIQGVFFDVSARTSTPSAFSQLSAEGACVGRTSRSMPATGLEPLAVGALRVEGTARGVVQAGERSPGQYTDVGAPLLGDDVLRIVAEAGDFPAFDEELEAPDPMTVAEPALDGTTLVELGELPVAWNAGNGDFVLIRIDPDQTGGADSGGDVVCVVPDDGCYVLPASVAVFLLAAQTDTFTMIVSRHKYRSLELDAESYLELEASSEVRGTIKKGIAE